MRIMIRAPSPPLLEALAARGGPYGNSEARQRTGETEAAKNSNR